MTEYENSKSDDQLEELLLLTEQMQEELDQKDRTIEKLKMQLDKSLTLNEKLNSENKAGNIQALKNDLRKTKELLQREKEKTHAAEIMTEECQDKLRQAEQERDYSLSHQKKVGIPVEKPVLYQKCGNCNQTAYLKAKEKYDTQREKLAGRYKTKTAMYEALMFLLIWYSVSTTLFQMIRSKIFISDCVVFFDTIATFVQTIAGWVVLIGKNVAQISNGISNPVVAGIIYWLIRILICGGCLVGAGIFLAFIGIKIVGLYKKYCWDSITIMVILISMATAIYFGKWIKITLPINLLFLLLFVQLVYVGIRWYVRGWRETRGYPFAFQVLGYLTWNNHGDYKSILPQYEQYLSEFVYDKLWSELSAKDKMVARGIAQVNSGKISEIRAILHMETNEFNPYRKRLIRKGLIDGETRGYVKFTLPFFFEEYVLEN